MGFYRCENPAGAWEELFLCPVRQDGASPAQWQNVQTRSSDITHLHCQKWPHFWVFMRIFSAPWVENSFAYLRKRVLLHLFPAAALRLPQWTWERPGWGLCCACSPTATCSMQRKNVALQGDWEISSNSVAFSPAGYIDCFGLIKLLMKPPPAALWSQSSVSVSWALFRLEPFLTPFLTQGVCQALCLSRNSHLLQHWGCHRAINKQLVLQRWCTGQKFCAGLCSGRMVMPTYQPVPTPYLIL